MNANNDLGQQSVPMGTPKKKNSITILLSILFMVIAAGGIGFGVWAMVDGNNRVEEAKNQCGSSTKCNVYNNDGVHKNPVIPAMVGDYKATVYSTVPLFEKDLYIGIKNGEIIECRYSIGDADCTISGINGKIYKGVVFGEGHDSDGYYQGFLMEDGTVQYFKLAGADEKTSYKIEGTLKIDGVVIDVVSFNVSDLEAQGGYGSTVFVLSDGSIVKFNESMLQ